MCGSSGCSRSAAACFTRVRFRHRLSRFCTSRWHTHHQLEKHLATTLGCLRAPNYHLHSHHHGGNLQSCCTCTAALKGATWLRFINGMVTWREGPCEDLPLFTNAHKLLMDNPPLLNECLESMQSAKLPSLTACWKPPQLPWQLTRSDDQTSADTK